MATVLNQIQDYRFRLRSKKCQFSLGFVFEKSGIYPNPEYPEAIQRISAPYDVSILLFFLRFISYYSAFIFSLYEKRAPLIYLLGKMVSELR